MSKYLFLDKIVIDPPISDKFIHVPNVVKTASSIVKKLIKNTEVVCCAEMQSGKTQVMARLIYLINIYNNKLCNIGIDIYRTNIFIIICASSINLKEQLQCMLPSIKNNIYHLNDIQKIIKNKYSNFRLIDAMVDHSLIMMDECHCDAEINSTIYNFRKILIERSKINNTISYIVGFSATPYEQIFVSVPKVIMYPGPGYYGLTQMFKPKYTPDPIIRQTKNLTKLNECLKLILEINIGTYYYIFRLSSKKSSDDVIINNLYNCFKNNSKDLSVDTYIYDMHCAESINDIVKIRPNKIMLIFIKDKLRMGEYLDTTHVYMVHDDLNTYTHTTAQSLLGRCCGYDKESDHVIIYCDYNKAFDHYLWIKNKYDKDKIPSDSKYIKDDLSGLKAECFYDKLMIE